MIVADLLAELVAFPTQQAGPERGAGNERALCEYLAPLLRDAGADEVIVESAARSDGGPGAYVFARWGTPTRIVNVHIDTVPANAGWSHDPWTPYIADGRLYGLGSADTKGAVAATLVAIEATRPRDFGVLFSGDEEAGGNVLRAFLAGPNAAAIREVFVCEPTARTAGVAHRGILAQRAHLHGPGGHSSKADHLPKPLAKLARFAAAVDDVGIRRRLDGPTGMQGTCLNIAALNGGVAFNVIPARGVLDWSLRPYPGFDRAAWDREITALAAAIDPAITIETKLELTPFSCDALADHVRQFVRSVGTLDFWTEAALWAAHGKDAIVIGPGDISQAHAADEFVPLEDLEWAVGLVRSLVRR
jgi:acetylornithine deacetylase